MIMYISEKFENNKIKKKEALYKQQQNPVSYILLQFILNAKM